MQAQIAWRNHIKGNTGRHLDRIKLIVNSGQVATHLQFKGKLIVEQKYVQAQAVSGECLRVQEQNIRLQLAILEATHNSLTH